ncbi:hypothetical protein LVD15_14985 [Fulvivirga maritima]|uniref:hypothetical protein n=1 Tax=Fulvivirga maritima TaxID=2904247 RepID=UPI001F3022DD|nr:hypothetical protein [Fulvivirga maritima]UII24627.1 hypothetical protein LVD15_14985 [Fulvivirga maritima]
MKTARSFLIICFLSSFFALQAQDFPSEIWHEGKIVLLEGDTLRGLVKYNLESDLIQYSGNKKTIKAYTGRKLLFFEIYDETVERYRQFFSIPYSLNGDYKVPIMFEVLVRGDELSLLCREAIEYQVRSYPYSMGGTYSSYVLVYTYYFMSPDGTIAKFSGKKKDLLYIMKEKHSEMKKYIKENKIDVDKRSDLAKALIYYNSLFDKT